MRPEQGSALQIELWGRRSPEERLRMIFGLIEDGFAMAATAIRRAHPECTLEEFRAALRKRIYDG